MKNHEFGEGKKAPSFDGANMGMQDLKMFGHTQRICFNACTDVAQTLTNNHTERPPPRPWQGPVDPEHLSAAVRAAAVAALGTAALVSAERPPAAGPARLVASARDAPELEQVLHRPTECVCWAAADGLADVWTTIFRRPGVLVLQRPCHLRFWPHSGIQTEDRKRQRH